MTVDNFFRQQHGSFTMSQEEQSGPPLSADDITGGRGGSVVGPIRKIPSKATLRDLIAQWEYLLRRFQCQQLQEPLEGLVCDLQLVKKTTAHCVACLEGLKHYHNDPPTCPLSSSHFVHDPCSSNPLHNLEKRRMERTRGIANMVKYLKSILSGLVEKEEKEEDQHSPQKTTDRILHGEIKRPILDGQVSDDGFRQRSNEFREELKSVNDTGDTQRYRKRARISSGQDSATEEGENGTCTDSGAMEGSQAFQASALFYQSKAAGPDEENKGCHLFSQVDGLEKIQESCKSYTGVDGSLLQKETICFAYSYALNREAGPSQDESIASRMLPQTQDFGVFPCYGNTDEASQGESMPPPSQTQKYVSYSPAAAGASAAEDSQAPLRQDIDTSRSQPPWDSQSQPRMEESIDSRDLPQTCDFGVVTDPSQGSRHASPEREPKQTYAEATDMDSEIAFDAGRKNDNLDRITPLKTGAVSRWSFPAIESDTDCTPSKHNIGHSSRRITPQSATERYVTVHDTRASLLRIFCDPSLSNVDEARLRSFAEAGHCTIVSEDEIQRQIASALDSSIDDVATSRNQSEIYLVVGAIGVKAPFKRDGTVLVCERTFRYFLSRIMGLTAVSSDWLGELLQRHDTIDSRTSLLNSLVWGDVILYDQTVGRLGWLKSSRWWENANVSPCQSSLENPVRRRDAKLLTGFAILVVEDEEDTRLPLDNEAVLTAQENDSRFYTGPGKTEMETLCALLGATVVQQIKQDGVRADRTLVLVPPTVDNLHELVGSLANEEILPPGQTLKTDCEASTFHSASTQLVYSLWVLDAISANHPPPLQPYTVGFLTLLRNPTEL